MAATPERRTKHRRFSDRRVHLLLALHEIIFDSEEGVERDTALLEELRLDFESDRAALVEVGADHESEVVLSALCGSWNSAQRGAVLAGKGLADLLQAHRLTTGAVTLTYTRRPSVFSIEGWDRLWAGDLGAESTALLSVAIEPERTGRRLLWLQEATNSREWSSQDRELAEEVASLLSRAADKARYTRSTTNRG
jgi:GAF domain-containing protein